MLKNISLAALTHEIFFNTWSPISLKSLCSATTFLVFWEDNLCLKCLHGSSLNLLQLYFVVSGSKKQGCREPIRTVFKQLFDHNADGLVDETELADLYEAEPCMKQFFKTCSKGKEAFTEAEFCSCFKSVGRSQVHIVFFQ